MWSGVPVVAVILAVTLSPDRRLPGTGSLSLQGSLLYCIYGGLYTATPPRPTHVLRVPCFRYAVCSLFSFPLTTPFLLEGRLTPVSWGGQLARVHEVRCPLLLSEVPGGLGTSPGLEGGILPYQP